MMENSMKKLLILVLISLTFNTVFSQTYQIKKYVMGASAQNASNDNYTFYNTVGQPAIGIASSADNSAQSGFWYDGTQPSTQTIWIQFNQGWNIVSSNIRPPYMDMETFMSDIEPNLVIAKDDNSQIYIPSSINTIGDWDISEGYNVYVSAACSLEVTGTEVIPENEDLNLNMGWNQVGYTRNSSMNPATAYNSIVSDVVIVKNSHGKIYIPRYNLNTIGDLNVGEGYLLYYASSGVFNYPANGFSKTYQDNYFDNTTKHFIPEYQNTGNNAVVLIHTDLPDNAELAVTSENGMILGAGVVRNNVAAVTVWGDNDMTEMTDGAVKDQELYCKYYYKGSEKNIHLENIRSLINDDNSLNYSKNFLKTADAYVEYSEKPVLYVSPNPVKDLAMIQFKLNYKTGATLKIVNSIGKTVKILNNYEIFDTGTHTVNFNVEGISQGVYRIVLTTDEGIITQPLMILK